LRRFREQSFAFYCFSRELLRPSSELSLQQHNSLMSPSAGALARPLKYFAVNPQGTTVELMMYPQNTTLFDAARQAFEGWTDPETGLQVLKLRPHNMAPVDEEGNPVTLYTNYHQRACFVDGGRRVMLRGRKRGTGAGGLLDLTTGEMTRPFPKGYFPAEVNDKGNCVLLRGRQGERTEFVLWDIATGEPIFHYLLPEGWVANEGHILSDGKRIIVQQYTGKYYDEKVHSQFKLLSPDGSCETILDADGFFCNHIQSCPTDPELIAYDRWPTPLQHVEVAIHMRTLDGSFHEPLKQLPGTVRCGPMHGGQRDHYVWTPDGNRIASYLNVADSKSNDHFDFQWWISALDWRTGEDLCAEYPAERWGCNFQVSADSKYIVTAGGREFQCIYLVDIEGLRDGWNERVLCTYPHSEEDGHNHGPFHMPFALPDGSGVIFTAGWPGPEAGVYLVEWPADIACDPSLLGAAAMSA